MMALLVSPRSMPTAEAPRVMTSCVFGKYAVEALIASRLARNFCVWMKHAEYD